MSVNKTQKSGKSYFLALRTTIVGLKVASEPWSKKFLMKNFWPLLLNALLRISKKSVSVLPFSNLQICKKCDFQAFNEFKWLINALSASTESAKVPFSKTQDICSSLQDSFKTFLKNISYNQLQFKQLLTLFLAFLENNFDFATRKIAKVWKIPFPLHRTFVLDFKLASKPYFNMLAIRIFPFKDFFNHLLWFSGQRSERFPNKNLHESEKSYNTNFTTLRTFVFNLRKKWKPYPRKRSLLYCSKIFRKAKNVNSKCSE